MKEPRVDEQSSQINRPPAKKTRKLTKYEKLPEGNKVQSQKAVCLYSFLDKYLLIQRSLYIYIYTYYISNYPPKNEENQQNFSGKVFIPSFI